MKFPTGSGDIRSDFSSCCSTAFLEILPDRAAALLAAGELQAFADQYPEFRSRFAAELRALCEVMTWITRNGEEESRRKTRGE
jgi:hypothetical protein